MGIGDCYVEKDAREARNLARDNEELAREYIRDVFLGIQILVSQSAVPGKVLPVPGELNTYVTDPATFQKLKESFSKGTIGITYDLCHC